GGWVGGIIDEVGANDRISVSAQYIGDRAATTGGLPDRTRRRASTATAGGSYRSVPPSAWGGPCTLELWSSIESPLSSIPVVPPRWLCDAVEAVALAAARPRARRPRGAAP